MRVTGDFNELLADLEHTISEEELRFRADIQRGIGIADAYRNFENRTRGVQKQIKELMIAAMKTNGSKTSVSAIMKDAPR